MPFNQEDAVTNSPALGPSMVEIMNFMETGDDGLPERDGESELPTDDAPGDGDGGTGGESGVSLQGITGDVRVRPVREAHGGSREARGTEFEEQGHVHKGSLGSTSGTAHEVKGDQSEYDRDEASERDADVPGSPVSKSLMTSQGSESDKGKGKRKKKKNGPKTVQKTKGQGGRKPPDPDAGSLLKFVRQI